MVYSALFFSLGGGLDTDRARCLGQPRRPGTLIATDHQQYYFGLRSRGPESAVDIESVPTYPCFAPSNVSILSCFGVLLAFAPLAATLGPRGVFWHLKRRVFQMNHCEYFYLFPFALSGIGNSPPFARTRSSCPGHPTHSYVCPGRRSLFVVFPGTLASNALCYTSLTFHVLI